MSIDEADSILPKSDEDNEGLSRLMQKALQGKKHVKKSKGFDGTSYFQKNNNDGFKSLEKTHNIIKKGKNLSGNDLKTGLSILERL